MITIKLNENNLEIEKESSIEDLLIKLDQSTNGIAIAINNSVISKSDWATTLLKEKDNILLIKATQGG